MYDAERIHDAIRTIYDAALNPDDWPAALQAIADCTGDVGTVLIWQRDDGSLGTVVSPDLEASHAEYIAHWSLRDTRAHRVVERGLHLSADTVTDRDVVDDDEIDRLPIYRDYLIPHGLGWFAATSVAPDPRVTVAISVQRRFERPRFVESELRLVSQLGRHVEQALRLGIRFFDEKLRSEGLAQALSSMNIGIFGLDSLRHVTMSNPAGTALLGKGLQIRGGALVPQFRANRDLFETMLERALNAAEPPEPRPVMIECPDEEHRIVVHFLPLTAANRVATAMLAQTRVLVLAVSVERTAPMDPTVLRDLLGLTLNEARIAALVGCGLQPRTVADRLGIAEETARTVLKRVFGKTGVSRQAELVALLARLSIGV